MADGVGIDAHLERGCLLLCEAHLCAIRSSPVPVISLNLGLSMSRWKISSAARAEGCEVTVPVTKVLLADRRARAAFELWQLKQLMQLSLLRAPARAADLWSCASRRTRACVPRGCRSSAAAGCLFVHTQAIEGGALQLLREWRRHGRRRNERRA